MTESKPGPAARHRKDTAERFEYVQVVGRAFPGVPAEPGDGAIVVVNAQNRGLRPVGAPYIERREDGPDAKHETIVWSLPVVDATTDPAA